MEHFAKVEQAINATIGLLLLEGPQTWTDTDNLKYIKVPLVCPPRVQKIIETLCVVSKEVVGTAIAVLITVGLRSIAEDVKYRQEIKVAIMETSKENNGTNSET